MFMKGLALAATAATCLAASSTLAATVELTSVEGFFENATWDYQFQGNMDTNTPDSFVRHTESDNEIWWGSPDSRHWSDTSPLSAAEQAAQSGYVFEGISASDNHSTNESEFLFGQLAHHNGSVWNNSATLNSVDIRLVMTGLIDGEAFDLEGVFRIKHNETLNAGAPCNLGDSIPCGDGITVSDSLVSSNSVVANGVTYELLVEGFVADLAGGFTTNFFTDESDVSLAQLRAQLLATPNEVPVPATMWLMAAGLGGFAAIRRRRKAA